MAMPGVAKETYPRIAEKLGITVSHVWDLADNAEEAAMTLSIRQIQSLSAFTGLKPTEILGIDAPDPGEFQSVNPEEFCAAITNHIQKSGRKIEEFEEQTGWEVRSFIDAPNELYDIANWECLSDVASAIGLNPVAVLPPQNTRSESGPRD